LQNLKFEMFIKKLISLVLLASTAAWPQSQITTPSTTTYQCQGPSCPNSSDTHNPNLGTRQAQVPGSLPPGMQNRVPSNSDNATIEELLKKAQTSGEKPENPEQVTQPSIQQPRKEEPSEFQNFVFSSTGQQLSIYGQSLFEEVPSTFAPIDHVPVPADYTIGPDDELLVRVWGQIDLEAKVVVDRNGQIYLPKVGALTVAGLKYEQLHSYLESNIGRLFKNFSLNVSLGRLRSIQIFVVGRARKPGAYTVGSLSTLVNALFASGGPDVNGSMRHISVKRQGQLIAEFDLYDLLIKGDKSKDVVLRPGDVVYVASVGSQVAIVGSVNSPAIYELRNDGSIGELVEEAGGLSTTADNSRAILERIESGTRKVEEFALDSAGLHRTLKDGDILHIFPVSPRFDNAVTLRGNVARPGRYPWRAGMHVHDLIPTRDAIVTTDYWARQNDLGQNKTEWIERNLESQRKAEELAKEQAKAMAAGDLSLARRTEEEKTDIKRNPSEINWDYAVIQRLNQEDLSSRLIPFNLGRAISDPATEDNFALEAGDVITIFSQADLDVPVAKRTRFIKLEGEIKAAGIYQALSGETLRDLVQRAGGLTPNAYLYAADFRRESTRLDQQKRLRVATTQMEAELQAKAASLSNAAGSAEELAAAREQLDAERKLLQRMQNTAATGRIVLELKPTDSSAADLPPLQLEDGDSIYVPSRSETVQVIGSVYNQNAFVFHSGKTLRDYLRLAGGGTKDADSSRVFVIRADGSVNSSQMHHSVWSGSFESLRLTPGDTVVVPQKIHGPSFLRSFRDWTQIFAQLALGAASIKVISQ
jgi:protein involved in polysaccharide export with SLBB domain